MDAADVMELRKSMNELSSKLDLVLHEQHKTKNRMGVVNEVASSLPSLVIFILIVAGLIYFYNTFLKYRL